MYGITDKDILSLLEHKATEGVRVDLFYDPSASPCLRRGLSPLVFTYPINSQGLMHRKILIIDKKQVFLGSANFTPQSLTMHDNLVLGFHSPPLAHFLSESHSSYFSFKSGPQTSELWLLPDVNDQAMDRLQELIRSAQKSIYIAMFTITHPLIAEGLKEAHQRGVKVKCAVDHYTGQGASAGFLQSLSSSGIEVLLSSGKQLLHHKWALIDGKTFISGSANWTRSAFSQNQDCFIILFDLDLKQKKFLDNIWNIIELEAI